MQDYSNSQQRALSWIPHVSGLLSLLASSYVIQDVLKDRTKRTRTYGRLLLGISTFDVLASLMYFLAAWPMPETTDIMTASGTTGTCNLQGFILQASLAVPLYHLGLALYYLVVLEYRWSDRKLRHLEYCVHILAITIGIGTAVACLCLDLYNNSDLWCWISSLPQTCDNSPRADEEECERGNNAWKYRWGFFYGPMVASVFVTTALMTRAAWHVYQTERRSRKWRVSIYTAEEMVEMDKFQKLSSQVFWQSLHFIMVLFVVWVFPTVMRTQQTLNHSVPAWVAICVATFLPLQGVFIFSVYIRPRYRSFREQHPTSSFLHVWSQTLRKRLSATDLSARSIALAAASLARWNNNKSWDEKEPPTSAACISKLSNCASAMDSSAKGDSVIQSQSDASLIVGQRDVSTQEEDADVMDPAHQFMMWSQRHLVIEQSYATRFTSSRFLGMGCIDEEEQQEEDRESKENGSNAPQMDRRRMWYAMMGVAKSGIQQIKSSSRLLSPRSQSPLRPADTDVRSEEIDEEDDILSVCKWNEMGLLPTMKALYTVGMELTLFVFIIGLLANLTP